MSNLSPAGKPAKTPRPDEIWDTLYQAFTSKTKPNKTEYVCTCTIPDVTCDLDCSQCPCYRPIPDWVISNQEYYDALVTEPDRSIEPGVTNEPCYMSAPGALNYKTYHQFHTWDEVSDEITKLCRENRMPAVFDIFAWKFMDGVYWHAELCPIPSGLWIEVEWGQDNVQ